MDTEFNINTQKGKNKLLGVVQTKDSLQTILRDKKNNSHSIKRTVISGAQNRFEKQRPAYNGVKKVLLRCKNGPLIFNPLKLSIEYHKAQRNRSKFLWLLNFPTIFFSSRRWASFWGKGCFFRGFTSKIRKKS